MKFQIFDLGLIDFRPALEFQKQLFERVKNGKISHGLILCRHKPVITLGRNAPRKNILVPEEELKKRGIDLFEIERGGDVTYHGPGQLTVYPIFNLDKIKKDIHLFLRNLEERIGAALNILEIPAVTRENLTGVWVNDKKIASIGIAVRNWVTFHGFTLNVKSDDLKNFSLIRPCGMDIMMTSVEDELGRKVNFKRVKELLIKEMQKWPK
ncbi:MAG: lipoyl(octanoyl) transferase LipB [Candidatus Omnitrophica bacterium]|nr:lipoyl(octanoyl) transferase LipB [Candidatus Omnitrophota bacterium]